MRTPQEGGGRQGGARAAQASWSGVRVALRSEELHPGAGSEREEQHGPLGFEGSLGCRAGGGSAGRDPAGPGAGRLPAWTAVLRGLRACLAVAAPDSPACPDPAVYPDGRVCISILHAPGDDPMGYESSAERWSPVQSVEKILLSVVSMLAGKAPPSPGLISSLSLDRGEG